MASIIERVSEYEIAYLKAWLVVEDILSYVTGDPDISRPTFPGLSPDALSLLDDETGRSELSRWVAVFARPIENFQDFNKQRAAGVEFNIADWKLMSESIDEALGLLRDRLEHLADSQAAFDSSSSNH